MSRSLIFIIIYLFWHTSIAFAGVLIGGTRVVYEGKKKEASLTLMNDDNSPYLIQSWIEPSTDEVRKPAFVITPPLFRMSGNSENTLRIVKLTNSVPEDIESMFWINIKSIPSSIKDSNKNTLQLAINTRIKLIYRPSSLEKKPEDVVSSLIWKRDGNKLLVKNPTPYFMNFYSVKVGAVDVTSATYVSPNSESSFNLPKTSSNQVTWRLITDFGGVGPSHQASFL